MAPQHSSTAALQDRIQELTRANQELQNAVSSPVMHHMCNNLLCTHLSPSMHVAWAFCIHTEGPLWPTSQGHLASVSIRTCSTSHTLHVHAW